MSGSETLFTLTPGQIAQLRALGEEDAVLEREIQERTARRLKIREILDAAQKLGGEDRHSKRKTSEGGKPDMSAAMERIAKEKGPLTNKQMKAILTSEGFGDRLGAYFYIAVKRLRTQERIRVLEDGRIAKP